MARKLRIHYEGAIYHVTLRSVDRRKLFKDDDDRIRFLKRLGEAVDAYGVRLYLFCLMANHVHLMVETPRANLSAFMHKLQTAYTVYYNLRHKRTGHLTQGRFGAKPVAGDEYLLKLSRYIHLNPIFVAPLLSQPLEIRISTLRSYRWSSYRGYAGLAKPEGFIDEEPVLAMMETSSRRKRQAYRRFAEAGIAKSDKEFLDVLKNSEWGIGGNEFQDEIRDRHTDMASRVTRPEDVSFREAAPKVSPQAVLDLISNFFRMSADDLQKRGYDCVARAVAAQLLGKHSCMNQRDIAHVLNMGSGSAVCLQLKRLRERREMDLKLNDQIQSIEAALQKGKQAL